MIFQKKKKHQYNYSLFFLSVFISNLYFNSFITNELVLKIFKFSHLIQSIDTCYAHDKIGWKGKHLSPKDTK